MQLTMFKEKTRENAHLTNLRQSTYTMVKLQTLHGKIARSLICNLRSKSFRHVVIRASVFHNSKGMKLSHTAILLRNLRHIIYVYAKSLQIFGSRFLIHVYN